MPEVPAVYRCVRIAGEDRRKTPSTRSSTWPHGLILSRRDNRNYYGLVALDVKNAFNSTSWKHVDTSLRNRGVLGHLIKALRSYIENRTLTVCRCDGSSRR
ncbi:Hypothetical protein CINCED_3A008810 [Cinara cedri]|uniref:Reverse transcriptase domain n=1 Tax=Cinara cedri TaxID=506608 RepID=A0A5E4MLZ3_9HEMI|nr:Hypothetical protein CINCED_3A008810 [Cinara cedri]